MSYTKIWVHTVWSTKNRVISISNSFRPLLLNHFREQSKEKEIQLDFINAHKNHIHALINLGRNQSISEVMHLLKGESSF